MFTLVCSGMIHQTVRVFRQCTSMRTEHGVLEPVMLGRAILGLRLSPQYTTIRAFGCLGAVPWSIIFAGLFIVRHYAEWRVLSEVHVDAYCHLRCGPDTREISLGRKLPRTEKYMYM